MAEAKPTIRTLSLPEVAQLIDWAAYEGWNPGLGDAPAFYASDPGGFIGAFIGGEMVAGVSAVAYGQSYGFIGLYICRRDMRGRGYGKAVWTAGMDRLKGRTIGLDGVDAQFENYRRTGFEPAYRTIRFGGRPGSLQAPAGAIPFATSDIADANQIDRRGFPAHRGSFLERWLMPPHRTVMVRNSKDLSGYAVMRKCREGWKVGPLFADHEDTAATLLAGLIEGVDGVIFIDVPEDQRGFIRRLIAIGLEPGFETTRMYAGPAPDAEQKIVFGVTTLELG